MKIYLVSLTQDVDRRKALETSFPQSYRLFHHVEAVDGRLLLAREYYLKSHPFLKKHKHALSPAELGCTLSHIKALELFLSSDEKVALILEDDVLGNDNDIATIESLATRLDKNVVLLCGGQEGLNRKHQLGKQVFEEVNPLYDVVPSSYKFMKRTCCYVVTKQSAQAIVDYHRKQFITGADRWGDFFTGTQIRIQYTNVLRHPFDLADSHIEKDRLSNQRTFLQKILSISIVKKIYVKVSRSVFTGFLKLVGYRRLP